MVRDSRNDIAAVPAPPLRVAFGGFLLDEADARLSRDGQPVPLPPKAFAVLCTLARHDGRLVAKGALLDAVWGHRHVSESVLKSTISQLRAALGDDVRRPRFIETASRHGYRFIAAGDPGPAPAPAGAAAGGTPGPAPDTRPVGRAAVFDQLQQAWPSVLAGRRQLVWITGEAGIGKTTVLDHWSPPARTGRGQCMAPFGAGEPYLPLLEAVSMLCRAEPSLAALLRRFAPTWLLQLPWLHADGEAASLRADLAGTSPERMLREGCEFLEEASRDEPLQLVLEDLHWSDASTVRLLEALALRRQPARLMVLGTFRPAELVACDHPLRQVRHDLRARGLCLEVALDPLSEQDVAALLRRRLPGTGDDRLAEALHARCDGLPLFLDKLLDDLVARSPDPRRDGRQHLEALALRIPESLAGVIESQFRRLPPAMQSVLRAASIRGLGFSRRCVADVLGGDEQAVVEPLHALSGSGAWIEALGLAREVDGRVREDYRFRHALVAQAVAAMIPGSERLEAHLRLARSLAARAGAGEAIAATEIALHFQRAESPAEARPWLAEAAASALRRFAPAEAIALASRALALPGGGEPGPAQQRLELGLLVTRAVAAAQRHGVGSAEALRDLERARELSAGLPHGPQHTWLLNGLGWTYFSRGELGQAADHGRGMRRQADAAQDALLALCADNLLGATLLYQGRAVPALSALDRALAGLAACADARVTERSIVDLECSVRVYRAQALAALGRDADARGEADAALARARAVGQPMSLCLALRLCCLLAVLAEDAAAADRHSAELLALSTRQQLAQSIGPAKWFRGWVLARAGDAGAGRALIAEGIAEYGALGMATGTTLARLLDAQSALASGDAAAARQALATAESLARARGEGLELPRLYDLLARLEQSQGEAGAAARARSKAARARRVLAADETG